jgi:hypothetical protein
MLLDDRPREATHVTDDRSDLQDLTDRLAIRRVVEECARHGDRRDTAGQVELFTPDGELAVFYGYRNLDGPVAQFRGHSELARALASSTDPERHDYHFLGQTIIDLDGDRATAETLCIAHQLTDAATGRRLRVTHNRYADTFVRVDTTWQLVRRDIHLAWAEDRDLAGDARATVPPR